MAATTSPLDDRGRITIRRELRPRLQGRVVQVLTPHGVLLRPVPDVYPDAHKLPPALEADVEDLAMREAP